MARATRLLVFAALTSAVVARAHPDSTPPFSVDSSLESPRITALRTAAGRQDPAAVEQFWSEVQASGTPLVEPAPGEARYSLVTFVYRGTEQTRHVVVVDGVATAVGGVDPRNSQMTRLGSTDVWYRTYKVRNDARFAYKVSENDPLQSFVDPNRRADSKADPLNPRVFATGQSFVELPDAPPQELALRTPPTRGSVKRTTFHSTILGNDRDIWIYTPPGFAAGEGPYPLLAVLDGGAYTTLVPVPTILDNLIADRRIAPMVAVMIGSPGGRRDAEYSCAPAFGDFVATELIPWLRVRYGASRDPQLTAVGGSSRGGLAASCAAFQHPEVFGKVLSQSGSYWWADGPPAGAEYLTERFARAPARPLQFFLEVGEMEVAQQLNTNRRLRDVLKTKGYAVDYREFNGNHTYLDWRGSFGDGVISLFGGAADRARPAR